MFHRREIDLGVGKSISDEFIIFISGCVFISCFFIKKMNSRFDGDCARERLLLLM
jgi:hypothetical protein